MTDISKELMNQIDRLETRQGLLVDSLFTIRLYTIDIKAHLRSLLNKKDAVTTHPEIFEQMIKELLEMTEATDKETRTAYDFNDEVKEIFDGTLDALTKLVVKS